MTRYPSPAVHFDDHVRSSLTELEAHHLLRRPTTTDGPQGPEVTVAGRRVLSLCSNNYLGLAGDPALAQAAAAAFRRLGVGSGASPHISGSEAHHRTAQQRLADFVRMPAALLFSSGYAANIGTLQALCGPQDAIFSDALNHASIIDGCRLSRARVHVFEHRNYDQLEEQLRSHRPRARAALIATDAVFSMDGTTADLPALRRLADRHDAALLVDEAHALGVLGPAGAGQSAATGTRPDILTGMLGKAFGTSGGFVAAPAATIALAQNRARSYLFSTAPPPALAALVTTATDLVTAADQRRARLQHVSGALRTGLQQLGYRVPDGATPILPVLIGDPAATMDLSARLLDLDVFVHGVRPPSVPTGTSRLRVTAMATHTDEHVQRALRAFRVARRPTE